MRNEWRARREGLALDWPEIASHRQAFFLALPMKKALFLLQLLTFVLLLPLPAPAAIIGYWRMEADNDAGGGVNVANEVAGNALIVASGSISGTVPANPVPQTGAANVGSLNGSTNIDGAVAYYAALDV